MHIIKTAHFYNDTVYMLTTELRALTKFS